MEWLESDKYIKAIEKETWIDPKSVHWFYHLHDDRIFTQTWGEFKAGMQIENHIGLSVSGKKDEGMDLRNNILHDDDMDLRKNIEDGSIIITKYELLFDTKNQNI